MTQIFYLVLYQPIFNLLIFFYNTIAFHNFALAIIFLTTVIRLVLYPFSLQAIKNQKSMQDIQVKLDELKKKYKNDKEKLAQEMLALYKREKVNPFSSCLPILVQFPFLIAVFRVFKNGVNGKTLDLLYPFVSHPGTINFISLGVDLNSPSPVLAVLAGLAQFWQTKMLMAKAPPPEVKNTKEAKDESMTAIMNKQMMFMMPALTVFIGLSFPAGLTLYWLVTTLLTIIQQKYLLKTDSKIKTNS
ncbi:MAG: preprotein translocase subunit YidC [Parcubacteria group bacterium Athens1014_10]|nr:MAG: preprotein translocase subunit YidC [Parcubacteria group bacterium Athens1014_10]TSD04512.1 MAG: preprotein translocase subunit YidC [Parcubacteria group bacterium Athens0714_12]